jgi:hypothetical protein
MTEPTASQDFNPQLGVLLDRLLAYTRHGSLAWERAGLTRRAIEPFTVNMTQTTVRIRSVDSDQLAPFKVELLDKDGVLVETITIVSFPENARPHYSEVMTEIYRLARRQALDVDNVINAAIQDLDLATQSDPDLSDLAEDDTKL